MDGHRIAADWIATWNSRDLDRILTHYADDIEMTSPLAARLVPESLGIIRGRAALRAYWSQGLALNPDFHFELVTVLETVQGITILYRNQRGQLVGEALFFDEKGLVVRTSASYEGPPAAPSKAV